MKRRASLFGGYPHEGIKSKDIFPSRVEPKFIEGKVEIFVLGSNYPDGVPSGGEELLAFYKNRIAEYHQALSVAEAQLSDIQNVEYPFIPEDFGFELSETKMRTSDEGYMPNFYQKGGVSLARKEDETWLIMSPTFNGDVILPNAHIAFIVLRSIGVIFDDEFGDQEFKVSSSEITKEELAIEEGKGIFAQMASPENVKMENLTEKELRERLQAMSGSKEQ